jgi:hypothetical protein
MADSKGAAAKELRTSWGWGRKEVPQNEVQSFEKFPTIAVVAVLLGVPALLIYAVFGAPSRSWAWLLGWPLLTVLLLVPLFAVIMVGLSRWMDAFGGGACDSDAFFTFKNAAFEARWKGKKIPIEVIQCPLHSYGVVHPLHRLSC